MTRKWVLNASPLIVLIAEVRSVLHEKLGASHELIAYVVELLEEDSVAALSLPRLSAAVGGPDDVTIVSAGVNGGAEVLVTGDKALLALRRVGAMAVMSPRQFWDLTHTNAQL